MSGARDSQPPRRRLSKSARREQILTKAIELFSAQGFDASTHKLAEFAGVTQPLLYNYFPSKEALIEAVYERIYLDRWDPQWDALLADRARPLDQRLIAFYADYVAAISEPHWLRVYLYSGLKALEINRKYMGVVEDRLLRPICAEIRAAHDLADPEAAPITSIELETVWTLHSGVFYHVIRREIFEAPAGAPMSDVVASAVRMLLAGAPCVFRAAIAQSDAAGAGAQP